MRLFYAIRPGGECLARLEEAEKRLRTYVKKGSFTRAGNHHVTLFFLGETQRLAAAKACLQQLRGKPFTLAFSGVGRFRRPDGDILWAAVQAEDELQNLYKGLVRQLSSAHFKVDDRPYTPHLTLARRVTFLPEVSFAQVEKSLPHTEMLVSAVCLMQSCRVDGKWQYRELDHVLLK